MRILKQLFNKEIPVLVLPDFVDFLCLAFLISFNFLWLWPFLNEIGNIGVVSAPLIPVFAASLSKLFQMSECHVAAYMVMMGQLLGVVAFYLFLKELTGRRLPGLMVSFFYSLPVNILALDRLRFAWIYGDGAHITALGLFPFICYFLLVFLKRGGATYGFTTSLAIALVGLISAFALFNLFLFLFVILFSEIILGHAKVKLARFFVVVLFAWGLVSFWYAPGVIWELISSDQGRLITSLFGKLLPISLFVGPDLLVLGYLIFESREGLQTIALALGFLVIYLFINLVEYLAYADVELYVLLPRRFVPELGLSLAFFLGIAATIVLDVLGTVSAIGKLILPKDEIAGEEKRGVSFLFLVIIWLLGMVFVYLVLPTDQILEDIKLAAYEREILGNFWVENYHLCFSNCPRWFDNLVGLVTSLVSVMLMSIVVVVGRKRGFA